jgi:hypothetical protein
LGAARLADERRQEAEQSARDLSEAIRNKNQAETDYFGAAEQAKNAQSRLNQAEEEVKKAIDITQLNNKVVEANPTEENISAYARSRRERFNDRLEVEIG